MKLLAELQRQVSGMGILRHAWFTSFNTDIEFVETYILPITLGANTPRNRIEYEQLQQELLKEDIDFRVFCDPRFLETNRIKRTCIPVHGIRPARVPEWFSDTSLFHPKVIYLEDRSGKRVIGAGSANLTISGWGRNLEAFHFFEITTQTNYRKIRNFFEQLCLAADISCNLRDRPNFTGTQENWRFVHSYQAKSFPEQLLADAYDVDIAVWSPYLPRDLAGFVNRLQAAAGVNDLRLHLVPDLIEGKYLRTEWSEELSQIIANRQVCFYDYPVSRDSRTEMCHAKLWKLPGKLAVGSWNFTGPGSNSLRDDQGYWSRDNNVEAGFIIDNLDNWSKACGKARVFGAADCAQPDLLEQEGLVVNALPPFDLHVSFDWHRQVYSFSGAWLDNRPCDGYSVCLPGVANAVPLAWNAQCLPMQPTKLRIDDSALLRDRVFKVFHADREILRGLIGEINTKSRRAQSFETLQDLLEVFVQGDDPQFMYELPFRIPLDTDTFPDEAFVAATSLIPDADSDAPARGGISYFRLFQSIRTYQQKLSNLEKLEELDRQVFTWPGCLLELVGKVRAELQLPGREVFKWFLANEVHALCRIARKRHCHLIRDAKERALSYFAIPEARWSELIFDLPQQPTGASFEYLDLVEKQCHYV